MQPGIFTKTFERPTLEESLDALNDNGLKSCQFNLESVGLPTLPDEIEADTCKRIRQAMASRQITMSALSGTFNMIHPDPVERSEGMRRLGVLVSACERLGTSMITLCTGTRDPGYMWRKHPENDSPEAWADMLKSISEAVKFAEEFGVTLVFEPELSNVANSAAKARRLLEEIRSPYLKVVIDGANLFHADDLSRMGEILDEAFELIGPDIALAHAKDLNEDGFCAAGTGMLDYGHYLSLLKSAGYDGPVILHSLEESQVAECLNHLKQKLSSL